MAWADGASPPTRGWTRAVVDPGRADTGFPAHAGMDPVRRTPSRPLRGLPRPRGDGPSLAIRDWWSYAGFPAHAGMDPGRRGGTPRGRRLPRPRGDGPAAIEVMARIAGASPPTRGWTRVAGRSGGASAGFPAHAGMDPCQGWPRCGHPGLPRPRGDGPAATTAAEWAGMASPPTRGWTRLGRGPDGLLHGFPAHAGMDPTTTPCTAALPRLPRPRGDGPEGDRVGIATVAASPPTRGWTVALLIITGMAAASPPTRGWTSILGGVRAAHGGFPAHAGMDPASWEPRAPSTWLPRPRGDGPATAQAWEAVAVASPPTRGWTRDECHADPDCGGFPAHAGMDRVLESPSSSSTRLPRPRGDGPRTARVDGRNVRASPPTRGWTRGLERGQGRGRGFPAHAGMDRSLHGAGGHRRRLPRPRGDGPRRLLATDEIVEASPPTRGWTACADRSPRLPRGFPAHAGMDPCRPAAPRTVRRLPRPRGDGPSPSASPPASAEASPPTRGWTQQAGVPPSHCVGFPAHAGMDPAPSTWFARASRLPRPRGDGPELHVSPDDMILASPPTRGWTLGLGVEPAHEHGFPAHAGMDPRSAPTDRRRRRLPRPRGDGPPADVSGTLQGKASPPTRGWTCSRSSPASSSTGFPAHAGMDPSWRSRRPS